MSDLGAVDWPPGVVVTERLVLRAAEARDRVGFVELLSSAAVHEYLGGARARDEIERELPAVPEAWPGSFVVELDGVMVGQVLLRRMTEHRRPAASGKVDLGYLFLPRVWGMGYAAEACAAALEWLEGVLPGEPVVLTTQSANVGSMRLAAKLVERTTFCFPDSASEPAHFGDQQSLPSLCELADATEADDLDDYIEAHIHGPVRFGTDVDALVLDPSFAGTPIETAARELGCPIEYHPGFRAEPATFDPAYRGPETVALAHKFGAELTPHLLGGANCAPQAIKYVWHCLARYGRRG